MSAPRKIWAASPKSECHFSARSFSDPDLPAHLYHHDDVVRELAEALERARSYLHWGRDRHKPVMAQIDAALAAVKEGET